MKRYIVTAAAAALVAGTVAALAQINPSPAGRFELAVHSAFVRDTVTGEWLYPFNPEAKGPIGDTVTVVVWGDWDEAAQAHVLGTTKFVGTYQDGDLFYADAAGRVDCGYHEPQVFPQSDGILRVHYAIFYRDCP